MPLSPFQMWQINQYPGVQLVFPQLYSLVDKRVVTVRIHPLGSRVENLEPVRVDLVLGVWQHLVPVCKNNTRHSKKPLIFYRNSCTVVSWITEFLYKCFTWQCWQGISRCTVFWRPAYFSCHHPLLPVRATKSNHFLTTQLKVSSRIHVKENWSLNFSVPNMRGVSLIWEWE